VNRSTKGRKFNFHRKGAKTAEGSSFSLAVALDGKRKCLAAKANQVDLKAEPSSFPLRERKA